jgi:hypothetical protein
MGGDDDDKNAAAHCSSKSKVKNIDSRVRDMGGGSPVQV